MNKITCPNCNKDFKLDNNQYNAILKQIRDIEFNTEIEERIKLIEKEKNSSISLLETQIKAEFQEKLNLKNQDLIEIKAQNEQLLNQIKNEKENQPLKHVFTDLKKYS